MRRFQNILYVTRGMEEEIDALKQALSLARNNATALHVLIVSPIFPKALGEYEAACKASLVDHVRASITNTQAALKMSPDEVPVLLKVECADTPAIHIVQRVLRDAHDLLIKQAETTEPRMGFRALDMQLLRQCPCPLWPGFIIGNTAENALRKLQCSLLALKPHGFVSQVRAY